jgi:hypothetical protein
MCEEDEVTVSRLRRRRIRERQAVVTTWALGNNNSSESSYKVVDMRRMMGSVECLSCEEIKWLIGRIGSRGGSIVRRIACKEDSSRGGEIVGRIGLRGGWIVRRMARGEDRLLGG